MAFIVSLLFAFVPTLMMAWFVYWLDRYEKEPLVLNWGNFLLGHGHCRRERFYINTVFGMGIYIVTGSDAISNQATASLVAPFVEEGLKDLAVLIVFLFFPQGIRLNPRRNYLCRNRGTGFCSRGKRSLHLSICYLQNGWRGLWSMVIIRDVVVAWQHPFFTAFTGIGLAGGTYQ